MNNISGESLFNVKRIQFFWLREEQDDKSDNLLLSPLKKKALTQTYSI